MSNTFLQAEVSNGIIKTGISDHFPIFANMKITKMENIILTRIIRKIKINESNIDSFRSLLKRIDCHLIDCKTK